MINLENFLENSKQVTEAATPAPWYIVSDLPNYAVVNAEKTESGPRFKRLVVCSENHRYSYRGDTFGSSKSDAQFIAYSRNTAEAKDQMILLMAEAMKQTRDRADDYADSWISKPIREAIARVEGLAKEAILDTDGGYSFKRCQENLKIIRLARLGLWAKKSGIPALKNIIHGLSEDYFENWDQCLYDAKEAVAKAEDLAKEALKNS